MKGMLLVAALAAVLAGCTSAQRTAADHAKCSGYLDGAKPNSQAYLNCRNNADYQRAATSQAMTRTGLALLAASSPPPTVTTTCHRFGEMMRCTSR